MGSDRQGKGAQEKKLRAWGAVVFVRLYGSKVLANAPRVFATLDKMEREGFFGPGIATADVYPTGAVVLRVDGLTVVVTAEEPTPKRSLVGHGSAGFALQLLPMEHPRLGGTREGSWQE